MKVYKVNLTEGELRLFSEFLEQREFEDKILDSEPTNLQFAWDRSIGVASINEYRREINDAFETAIRTPFLSEKDLDKISNKMAEKQTYTYDGMGRDADHYIKKYPELQGTETGKMLENLSVRGKGYRDWLTNYGDIRESSNKKKLAKKYKESIKTIRENNDKALADILMKPKNSSYNSKTDKPLEEIKDVPIITEPEGEDKDTLALAHQVRFNEEQKKKLSGVKPSGRTYNPKTDQPLEEIKDAPIITEPEEKERTKELNKFRKDRKREEFVNKVKEIPGKVKNKFDSLSEKYEDISDGRSLGKDAAIIAGTTAALGAGAYGIHKYLKNKKKNKEVAEKKYKTSDKKKE